MSMARGARVMLPDVAPPVWAIPQPDTSSPDEMAAVLPASFKKSRRESAENFLDIKFLLVSGALLQNLLGVLRLGSGRTERIRYHSYFSVHAEVLEAFLLFVIRLLRLSG